MQRQERPPSPCAEHHAALRGVRSSTGGVNNASGLSPPGRGGRQDGGANPLAAVLGQHAARFDGVKLRWAARPATMVWAGVALPTARPNARRTPHRRRRAHCSPCLYATPRSLQSLP
jgi:hypothetical protein